MFVQQAYRDLLGREAEPDGLAFWSGLLQQGQSRNQVIDGIAGNTEFRSEQIDRSFQTFLHRSADAVGMSYFLDWMAKGASTTQVQSAILASPEYYQNRGNGTNDGFLSAMFADVLGRPVDPAGQTHFGVLFLLGGVQRSALANLVVQSPEAQADFVEGLYQHFLRRSADTNGVQYWVAITANGTSPEEILAGIAGSDEYATLTQTVGSQPSKLPYDFVLHMAYVGDPGNASVGVNGFSVPRAANVPGNPTYAAEAGAEPLLGAYQEIGGVPYVYALNQTELTVSQYVTFLNKVDPDGANPVQPFTGVQLWSEDRMSPVKNPLTGQINRLHNAASGEHYQLAAEFWRNKPLAGVSAVQLAYFANSLYNGVTVAIDKSQAASPLGFPVDLQARYVSLSTTIATGMYDLQDTQWPFFHRLDTAGYVIPSENEWVKAGYYTPLSQGAGNGTHYFYYPTASNQAPTSLTTLGANPTVDGLGNLIEKNLVAGTAYANYLTPDHAGSDSGVYWRPPYDNQTSTPEANFVDVGEDRTPSPWLTFDQGGNVVEFTDTTTTTFPPNPSNLPVYVKIHGGVANATEWQLWVTATGTSDPYGTTWGQVSTQGGGRIGYVPNMHADLLVGTSRGVSASRFAEPLASDGVVYRIDGLVSYDTFYTTGIQQAITLSDDPTAYSFIGASFIQVASNQSVPLYGFVNKATRTSVYTVDVAQATQLESNPGYTSRGVVASVLPPNVGAVNFRRLLNATTGAYAYSASNFDTNLLISLGYAIDGLAWSVNGDSKSQ